MVFLTQLIRPSSLVDDHGDGVDDPLDDDSGEGVAAVLAGLAGAVPTSAHTQRSPLFLWTTMERPTIDMSPESGRVASV